MPLRTIRFLLGLCAAFATVAAHAEATAGLSDQMEIQGPWAYGDSSDGHDGAISHVAITQSGETEDVWFAFSCSEDPKLFASIVEQEGIAASRGEEVAVDIKLGEITHLTTSAKKASDTVMVFDPAVSWLLFNYAIHERSLQITLSNSKPDARTYTFQLQPNNAALQAIIEACVPEDPSRGL